MSKYTMLTFISMQTKEPTQIHDLSEQHTMLVREERPKQQYIYLIAYYSSSSISFLFLSPTFFCCTGFDCFCPGLDC